MKKPVMRLYLDTSVFGGVQDKEFERDSKRLFAATHKRKAFVMLFNKEFNNLTLECFKTTSSVFLIRYFKLKRLSESLN